MGVLLLSLFFMQVHRDLSLLPRFHNAVITIGTFDGVHAGHRKIIAQLKQEATEIDGETVIITFHPHPRKVVREGQSPVAILTTLDEKIELLEALFIDHLVIIPFDEIFAAQTADEYIRDFLYKRFQPHTIIIGYDHKFGKGRSGDFYLLKDWGKKLGFIVKEISEEILNEIIISSTKIRTALLTNKLSVANEFLTYPYFFEGIVVKGKQLGRTIGYPTANIEVDNKEKLIPGNGIYAVEISGLPNEKRELMNPQALPRHFQGMMSVGLNPTVNGTVRTIEVNIFDFDEDIYAKIMRIYFKHYLRSEEKFSSLDALKEQLAKDKQNTLTALNR